MPLPMEDDSPLHPDWRRVASSGWSDADLETIRKHIPRSADIHMQMPIQLMAQLSRIADIRGIPRRLLVEQILTGWVAQHEQ